MERSLYIYHNADGFEPVILSLRDDGDTRQKKTTCPCGKESSKNLQLIGHLYEAEQVCFKDLESRQLCVWDVRQERVVQRVDFDMDPMDIHGFWGDIIGFSRTRAGELKFLRVWHPQHIFDAHSRDRYLDVSCVYHGGRWMNQIKTETNSPFTPKNQIFCFAAGHLYCVGKRPETIVVMDYNVDTDERVYLPAPVVDVEETIFLEDLKLGHGGRGELTACIFVPMNTPTCPQGQLRVFSFQDGVWHPLRFYNQWRPVRDIQHAFVPIFFFLGREDRLLKCVFLKSGDEVVLISSTGKGRCRSRTLFSYPVDDRPSLLACNVASAGYVIAQGTDTDLKWNKRAREPDNENEDVRARRVTEGLRSFGEDE